MQTTPQKLLAVAVLIAGCALTGCPNRGQVNKAGVPAQMPNVPADKVPPVSGGTVSTTLTPERDATARDLAELTGKELKLTKLVSANKAIALPAKGLTITMQLLEEGHVAGQGPVNRYFGDLHLADKGVCNWAKPLGSTRMAGPPEAMELENKFFGTLGDAVRLMRIGDGLRLETADKSGAVEFHPAL